MESKASRLEIQILDTTCFTVIAPPPANFEYLKAELGGFLESESLESIARYRIAYTFTNEKEATIYSESTYITALQSAEGRALEIALVLKIEQPQEQFVEEKAAKEFIASRESEEIKDEAEGFDNIMSDQLTPEQINEFKEKFDLFDVLNEGTISRHYLCDAIKSIANPSPSELAELMNQVDGNSTIDYPKFLRIFNSFQEMMYRPTDELVR